MYGQNFASLENLQEQLSGLSPAEFAHIFNPLLNFDFSRLEDADQMWMPIPDLSMLDPSQLSQLAPPFLPNLALPNFIPSEVSELPLRPLMANKKIGPLTIEERNLKIQRFREKRNRRSFGRKVSYVCRKKVADSRLRVRGRFITKSEAEKMEQDQESE